MPSAEIIEFTDPACPFAFSAEPHRLRLRWLFGDQLRWSVRMVGLAESREQYARKGLTPELLAGGAKHIADRWGMPISEEVREAVAATVPACRAVVAARLHAPEQEWALLRRLRHLAMAGGMLDDPALITQAATDVGIDPAELERWTAGADVQAALEEDMRQSREPSEAALALKDKLASDDGVWRYTCPSYEMQGGAARLHMDARDGAPSDLGAHFSAPGMQSSLSYETALANLAPDLERRPEPEDVTTVLRWAGYPLATQEVAEVCAISRDAAREQLEAAGAHEEPVGRDGFWTLSLAA